MPHASAAPLRIAVAVVIDGRRILVGTRDRPPFAGCDEFPGGKMHSEESPAQAAVRECREETGIAVQAGPVLLETSYTDHAVHLALTFIECHVVGSAETVPSRELPFPPFRWVDAARLDPSRFPPANRPVLAQLPARCSARK